MGGNYKVRMVNKSKEMLLLPFYSERFFHFLFCFETHQVQMFYWLTAQPRKENNYTKPHKII